MFGTFRLAFSKRKLFFQKTNTFWVAGLLRLRNVCNILLQFTLEFKTVYNVTFCKSRAFLQNRRRFEFYL